MASSSSISEIVEKSYQGSHGDPGKRETYPLFSKKKCNEFLIDHELLDLCRSDFNHDLQYLSPSGAFKIAEALGFDSNRFSCKRDVYRFFEAESVAGLGFEHFGPDHNHLNSEGFAKLLKCFDERAGVDRPFARRESAREEVLSQC